MSYRILIACSLLVINLFIIYYRSDILVELFAGRPAAEVELSRLILPLLIFIVIVYLLLNKKKNEKAKAKADS